MLGHESYQTDQAVSKEISPEIGLALFPFWLVHNIKENMNMEEVIMETYVLMTKLSPEVTQDLQAREAMGQEWKENIKKKCPGVKWIAHYCLLGPYDFMDIYEAPNAETAAKVSLITLSSGATKAESWTALPYKSFLKIVSEISEEKKG